MLEDEYLTTQEVAERLRTSPDTVRYWRHVGKGPQSFKVGRRVLYPKSAVDEWIAEAMSTALNA
jgi:excisionase family DNA binding protein